MIQNVDSDITIDEFGNEEGEPMVTSADANERKLARKLRIERRLENIRKQNIPEGEEEEEVAAKTLLQQQLEKSAEVLEKLVIDADEYVSNVRIANEGREVDRRDEEGIGREKIIQQLEDEALAAEEIFNEIAEKWEGVMKYHDPLHINEEIIAQKEKCDELIKQKDGIIVMLKNQIKEAEKKFAKDQRKQTEDIETLSKRIEKQITLMRRAYRQELQLIEDVMMVERKILVDTNNKKWEEMYKKRDQEEENNCEVKFEQVEEFENVMQKLRRDFQEKYRETKIKLENDIESLEQEFEHIKALALFNSEKLDYNYQILHKREDENIIIRSQQKRRINKMQDAINDIRKKSRDYEQTSNTQIARLTEDVQKLRKSIFDIERTADLFQKNNDDKYQQVWNFNYEIATKELNKIFTIDKLLYEQQLGLKWLSPQDKLYEIADLPSYKSALEVVSEMVKKKQIPPNISDISVVESIHSVQIKEDLRNNNSNCSRAAETLAYRRLLRQLLKQISDKTGFFIEERLKMLLKPYTDDEKSLVRVDNVFAALNVTKKEDIEILVKYFLPYTHCPVCTGAVGNTAKSSETEIVLQNIIDYEVSFSTTNTICEDDQRKSLIQSTETPDIMSAIKQPSDTIAEIVSNIIENPPVMVEQPSLEEGNYEGPSKDTIISVKTKQSALKKINKELLSIISDQLSCEHNHPLVISSVYILKALREFISDFYVPKEEDPDMAARLAHKRSTISRLMNSGDVKMFWEKFQTMFYQQRVQLWDGLYLGLEKYHAILKDRQKIQNEVVGLRRQNVELKKLLASYMDKANKMQPPCAKQREIPLSSTPKRYATRKL